MGKKITSLIVTCSLAMVFLTPAGFGAQSGPEQDDMVILVDRSSSMKNEGGDPKGLARAAVDFLIDQLELANDADKVALVLFNSIVATIPPGGLTADKEAVRSQLQRLAEVKGNTDLEVALQTGLQLLTKSQGRRQMVLISDGLPEPDFSSARAQVRFQEQAKLWGTSRNEQQKRNILQQMSQISAENILKNELSILKENRIEIYPIALSGIEAHGEKLLRQMALQVTQDAKAFKKISGDQLVAGLDEIVPKPVGLLNIFRAGLTASGQSSWSVNFPLDSSLERVRILILYQKSPPKNISWELKGPMGVMTAAQPGAARYLAAKDENGAGNTIFERLFLDNPQAGNYTLTFNAKGFLPPLQVIVEGRTSMRLAATAEPNPGEVQAPVTLFCRLEGGADRQLHSATARIVNEGGEPGGELSFSRDPGQALKASWTPLQPGNYRILVTGYLDPNLKRFLSTRLDLRVQPKQAVELKLEIPVRK